MSETPDLALDEPTMAPPVQQAPVPTRQTPPSTPAPPTQVQFVSVRKLFSTIVLAILAAVAIIMGASQATGYNLYTGDELQSHQAERLRGALGSGLNTSGDSSETDSGRVGTHAT